MTFTPQKEKRAFLKGSPLYPNTTANQQVAKQIAKAAEQTAAPPGIHDEPAMHAAKAALQTALQSLAFGVFRRTLVSSFIGHTSSKFCKQACVVDFS